MMKKLLSALLILISINCFSQTTGYLRYDTVKIMKQNGNSNLIIENATRGLTNAFLQNYSEGRTKFAYALDSVWIDGDSVRFRYGGTTLAVLASVPEGVNLPDGLISGGEVTYSGSGMKFYINPAVFRINSIIYTTDYDSVTLSASDPDDPRKDVIYLATTGVEVAEGTPGGPAAEPQLDADQIELTVIDVPAAATTPGLTTNVIWDENTESVVSTIGAGITIDADNATNVYRLLKSVNVSSVNTGDGFVFTLPSTIDANAYNSISFFLKLKAVVPAGVTIRVTFYNGATKVSSEVNVAYNSSSLTYQGLSLPMTRFSFSNSFFDKVQIRYIGSSTVHAGFYIDYVTLTQGFIQPGGGSGSPVTIGPIDSKPLSPNGMTAENNIIYPQTATQTYPGLLSPADKTKLDSLKSDYYIIPVGDGEELATQVNDSTVGIKTLKEGTNVTLDVTDTTITINSTGGGSANALDKTKIGADFALVNDSLRSAAWLNPKDLGAAGDNSTNDLSYLVAAAATGRNIILLDTFFVTGSAGATPLITLNENQIIEGLGIGGIRTTSNARIVRVGQNGAVRNVNFIGSGSKSSGLEYQTGVYAAGTTATGARIEGNTFNNLGGTSAINGGGIVIEQITTGATEGIRIINNRINNCAYGIVADVRAEYVLAIANVVDSCDIGVYNGSGNFNLGGFTIQNCNVGYDLKGGTNDGHCVSFGGTANHNTKNLRATDLANGYAFYGAMFYAGDIDITNSNGVRIYGDISTATVTLTNSTNLYFDGKWLNVTESVVSGERFNVVNRVRTTASTAVVQYEQVNADTIRWRGPLYHLNKPALPSTTSSADSLMAIASDGQVKKIAQSDVVSGGGAGSGVVNAGAANALTFYPSAGTTVDDVPNTSAISNAINLGFYLNAVGTTETSSAPVFTTAQTWNNAGVTFVLESHDATSTASAAGSLLSRWRTGGTDQFSIRKDGWANALVGFNVGSTLGTGGSGMELFSGNRILWRRLGTGIMIHDGTDLAVANTMGIGWQDGAIGGESPDTKLNRDGAGGIIAQKNGTSAQEFRIYNTDVAANDEFASIGFQNSSNVFQIATEKLASGVERDLELVSGAGNTRVTKLAGSGTRMVVADASGNLSTQAKITLTKNATIENPTSAENMSFFRTPVAITVTDVTAVLVGSSTPSVTYQISFGTDRTSATNVYSAGQTVTSTTTGTAASGVNDATIPAGSFVWITTSAQSGTVGQIFISLTYTED